MIALSLEENDTLDKDILNEINKISHIYIAIKRRIMRELVELKKLNAYIRVEYIEREDTSYNNISRHFIINITIMLKNENNIYNFEITNDYPFRSPNKFTINYRPYIEYLKIYSSKTIQELKIYKGLSCLCCNSISCPYKWTPTTNIIMCINEFKKFKKYRRDIINKLFAEKIKKQYLLQDINLLEWLQ